MPRQAARLQLKRGPLVGTGMLATVLIVGIIGGALAGPWTVFAIRSAVRKPAQQLNGTTRALRPGIIWWSMGAVFGIGCPLLFIALYLDAQLRKGGGSPDILVIAGMFALGGAAVFVHALRYRVFFDLDTVTRQSSFGHKRSLRWADLTSVTWAPISSRLVLRGPDPGIDIRVGAEEGFLDFVAAVEEHVAKDIRGDAVERARRSIGIVVAGAV